MVGSLLIAGLGLYLGASISGIFRKPEIDRPDIIATSEWLPFSAPDGTFTVQLPGSPNRVTEPIDGGLSLIKFFVQHKQSNSVFAVAYIDAPDASWETVVRCAGVLRDNVVKTMNGKVAREGAYNERATGGKGYEFVIEPVTERGRHIQRLFVADGPAGKRIYVLVAVGSEVPELSIDAPRYFDSFQLTARQRK